MASSLDNLSKNLEKHQFVESSKYFPKEHLNLITRKLAYPYEFMDCLEKYQETQLPPIEMFYSSLNNEHVNENDYENAQQTWNKLKINMREFTNQYNESIFYYSLILWKISELLHYKIIS
jgi:hypothetical protein